MIPSRASRLRHSRPIAAAVSLAALLTTPHAEAADASSLADALFHEANDLLAAGKISEACAKFAESERIDPQLGTLLNLAACHEKEGKTATAWSEFDELAEKASARGDTARVTFARAHVAALEKRLSRLRLLFTPGIQLSELRVDGEPLGSAAWTTDLPLDPGAHVLALSAPGKKTRELPVTVTAEAGIQTIDIAPLENEAPTPAPSPPVPEPQPSAPAPPAETQRELGGATGASHEAAPGLGPTRVAGLSIATVGVVGLGIGSIFGVMAGSSYGNAKSLCGGDVTRCRPGEVSQANSEHDQAATDATVSTVAFLAGGVLVGTGAVVFFWVGGTRRPATTAWTVAPSVGPGHMGLSLGARFE